MRLCSKSSSAARCVKRPDPGQHDKKGHSRQVCLRSGPCLRQHRLSHPISGHWGVASSRCRSSACLPQPFAPPWCHAPAFPSQPGTPSCWQVVMQPARNIGFIVCKVAGSLTYNVPQVEQARWAADGYWIWTAQACMARTCSLSQTGPKKSRSHGAWQQCSFSRQARLAGALRRGAQPATAGSSAKRNQAGKFSLFSTMPKGAKLVKAQQLLHTSSWQHALRHAISGAAAHQLLIWVGQT